MDTSLGKLYRFFTFQDPSSLLNLSIFYFTIGTYLIGQFVIIQHVKSKIKEVGSDFRRDLKLVVNLVTLVQYFLSAILITIVFQLSLTSGYAPSLLKVTIWLSYIQAIVLTALLAYKFFLWLRLHRSYVLLLYGLAVSTLSVNALFTLLHVNEYLAVFTSYITPHRSDYLPYLNPDSTLTSGFQISSIASYVLLWLATIVVLHNHSKRFTKIRYWITISIPLVYFIIQFQPFLLQLLASYRFDEPIVFGIIYTLFFSPSTAVGGILFGIAFWSVGRKVENTQIKDLMNISAYGIVLFLTSNQAIGLISAPYPPFGLATISFIGVASYLVLFGIYSSAVSVAQDITLRKSIRRSLEHPSAFLDKIGTSEMEQQVQRRVFNMTNNLSDEMKTKSGIEPSLASEDLQDYINKVIREIKR